MSRKLISIDTVRQQRATRDLPLFRQQAVEASRRRWFGPVRVMTAPSWNLSAFVAVAVIALLSVAGTAIEIPDRIRTSGMLLPESGLFKVKSPRAGRIEKLMIRSGEHVDTGHVMMRISGLQNAPGFEPELQARIASLERQLAAVERGLVDKVSAVDFRMDRSGDRLRLVLEQIELAEAEIRTHDALALLNSAAAERLARLAASRAVAKQVADEAQSNALHARATRHAARQRLLELREKRILIELQLNDDRLQVIALRDQAGRQREEIARQIASGRLQSALELTASTSGVVSGVTVAVGEVVAAGDVLATLHDPVSPLEARLYLPSTDYGRIGAGQRVELALPAYPREIYGTLSAVVASVSSAAVPANEIVPGLSSSGPVFEVRASLEDTKVLANEGAWVLPAGTTVSADIVRHRWPLYRWLWRSLTGGNLRT